jgi:hypothetical protein
MLIFWVPMLASSFAALVIGAANLNAQPSAADPQQALPPVADDEPKVQTFEEALQQDAEDYAKRFNVTVIDARRRLQAMRDTASTRQELQETFGPRLTGISIEHVPELKILVRLTGDTPVPDRSVTAAGMTVPIQFRTGAQSTLAQLRAASDRHHASIKTLIPQMQGIGIDTRTGELVVVVNAVGAAAAAILTREAELEALTGVPIRIRAIDGVERNSDVRGGSRVASSAGGLCTSGFVVKDTTNRTGVITAAHCADVLTYYNPNNTQIPLAFVGGWGSSTQDVQVHVSNYIERPEFYVDTAKTTVRRPVGQYALSATWPGDNACHRGETTGASCSMVEYVYYRPEAHVCGGYCSDTWVTVFGPHCAGGDSGGPVYDLNLARGIQKASSFSSGGMCNYYIYMSLDYLPSGWSLLNG